MTKIRLFSKNNLISYLWDLIFPNKIFFLNTNDKNSNILNCDFISLKERINLETQSIQISNKLISNKIKNPYQEFLTLSVKKKTSIEVNKLLTYDYISKYLKNKKFKKKNFKLIIFDTKISFFLYLKLKKKLNLKFHVDLISIIFLIFKEIIKILFFLFNILILNQINLIISLFNLKKVKKTNLGIFYNLDNSQKNYFETDLNPNNIHNKINYIFDNKQNLKKNIKKKSVFHNDIKYKINFLNYLNKIYTKKLKLIFEILRIFLKYNYCSITFLKNLNSFEKWSKFSLLYRPKIILSSMIDNDPFFYLANKTINTELIFIYFSFHSGLKIIPKKRLMFLDYSFMKYDKFILHKKDILLFKHKYNYIKEFKPVNVFELYLKKKNKKNLNSRLKKIVFFDSNYGFKKSQSMYTYNIFLDTIIDISKKLDLEIFIKSKLSFRDNLSKSDEKIKSKLEIIKNTENINYLDNNIISSRIIKKCDLSISLFTTTTFYESIYLGIPSIFFDPSKKYKNFLQSMSNIKYQKAYTKKELIKNIIILNNLKNRKKLRNESNKFLKNEININKKVNLSKTFNY